MYATKGEYNLLCEIYSNVGKDLLGKSLLNRFDKLMEMKDFLEPVVGQQIVNMETMTVSIWIGDRWVTQAIP